MTVKRFDLVQVRLYWQANDVVSTSLRHFVADTDPFGPSFPPQTVPLQTVLDDYSINVGATTRQAMSSSAWYRGVAGQVIKPTPGNVGFSKGSAGSGHIPFGMLPGSVGMTLRFPCVPDFYAGIVRGRMTLTGTPINFRDGGDGGPNATGVFWGNVVAQWFASSLIMPGPPIWIYHPVILSERWTQHYFPLSWSVSPTFGTYRRRTGLGSKILLPPELGGP